MKPNEFIVDIENDLVILMITAATTVVTRNTLFMTRGIYGDSILSLM